MPRNVLALAAAIALFAGSAFTSLHAQAGTQTTTTQTTTQDANAPKSQTTTVQTTTQQVNTTQTFMGKIDKQDDQYILEDSEKKATYKLDDATKADQFEGDNVKVVGTLDSSNNMIRVQSIEKVEK